MEKLDNDLKKYAMIGITTVFAVGVIGFGGYIKYWENKQPRQSIENVRVESIEPYNHYNDLHLLSRGYRVEISDGKIIDFPERKLGDDIKKGNFVDLSYKKLFQYLEIDIRD
ncbi:hypothetical protein KAI32_03320 [Candidatus Pacearchaeota archaeon]|nr:hypothetical protein [Candidatus Pacearchaeota archaeon]